MPDSAPHGGTVLVVAGGDAPTAIDRSRWPHADTVIAADAGVDHALAAGLVIDLVVGDMDSATAAGLAAARSQGAVIERFPPDKNETDLELALDRAQALHPLRIVVTAIVGGRVDHLIANLLLAASCRYAGTPIDIVSGSDRMYVVHDRRLIEAIPGATLTLLPVHGDAKGITTEGLEYPLSGETLSAGSPRGVSNVVADDRVIISVTSGTLVVLLPETGASGGGDREPS